MKYLCLVYGEEKKIAAMINDECMAYDQDLRASGRGLAAEALQPVRTARPVQVRKEKCPLGMALLRKRRSAWQDSV